MEDGAFCYETKIAKNFLDKNVIKKKKAFMPRPRQLSNMNSVELSAIMVRKNHKKKQRENIFNAGFFQITV